MLQDISGAPLSLEGRYSVGGGALKSGTVCENADLRFNSTGIKSKCNNSRQASLIQEHPGQLELASGMQK